MLENLPGEGGPPSMSTPVPAPTCQHQFTDHTTCNGVALHNHSYCMWHRTEADRRRRATRITRGSRQRRISLTLSHDPRVVRHNLQQVIDAMIADRISNKRAGILLYAIANTVYS